ncbi:sulfatase-like hydrolase/transferase [Paracoccus beibuensis]|uniref:sulfatase-like hydrolase/transferase n=1 Tax=Paracoccus beibuensis TaxID=547602 RepID=UPI002240DAB9|nr:sulfatase-like hydrolase/transferase [Paracoccus beibuensis]
MILRALAALVILHLLTALPSAPVDLDWTAWLRPAPELAILLIALMSLGTSLAGRALRLLAVVALALVSVLRLADMSMLETLGRRFNPVADLPLIDASVRLIAGSIGVPAASAAVAGAAVLLLAIVAGLWWSTGVWMRLVHHRRRLRRGGAVLAVALTAALVLVQPAGVAALVPQTTRYGAARVDLAARTLEELAQFRADARMDPMADLRDPLARIDRDVLVIFLESYGRTSFDTPFFATDHLPILADAQVRLEELGLSMRSGFLTSPTHGGQSWLAHATFANGLLINDQTRHQASVASGRRTLFHYASAAGFRTAAVMPAIVRPWPEAETMGFDHMLTASDLGYAGLPFNWVTMPDQFTLTALDRNLRDGGDPRPLFAQVALISSHAPWTPVPWLLDWAAVRDGTEFNVMAQAGDPPNVVWQDRDRVREHYRDTISYVLKTVTEYVARHADDPPLILLLGDHQAASSIGLDDRREVPLHVIGPPELVDATAGWSLVSGLIPPPDSDPLPMESLRDRILRSFSGIEGIPPA